MKRVFRLVMLLAAIVVGVGLPREASAQRRGIRRPPPRSVVYVQARPYYYYRPAYFRPSYYSPAFAFGGYAGWYSWYGGYPFSYAQYPYPYGRHYRDYTGSARLQVEPREAEVFADGYFVGTVDDFDGWLQRLHLEPGEHELEIYLRGHRTYRQNVLFRPGVTLKIEHVMQPLAPGDPDEARPAPSPGSAARQPGMRPDQQGYPRQPGVPVPAPRRPAPDPQRRDEAPQDYGSLAIRVQPLDAEVIVNGDSWQSLQAGSITLQLSDGTHRIEVRKDGYRPYSAEVRVRRGETTSVNISLSR